MFSHIVIWWTKPEIPDAADRMIEGVNRLLKPLPGVNVLHVGKMVPSHRPVVDQSYQVGMTIIFPDKAAHDQYMVHPDHDEFVREYFEKLCVRDRVYDYA